MNSQFRHCERSEAIPPLGGDSVHFGDCFVGTPALAGGARESALLAMTEGGENETA